MTFGLCVVFTRMASTNSNKNNRNNNIVPPALTHFRNQIQIMSSSNQPHAEHLEEHEISNHCLNNMRRTEIAPSISPNGGSISIEGGGCGASAILIKQEADEDDNDGGSSCRAICSDIDRGCSGTNTTITDNVEHSNDNITVGYSGSDHLIDETKDQDAGATDTEMVNISSGVRYLQHQQDYKKIYTNHNAKANSSLPLPPPSVYSNSRFKIKSERDASAIATTTVSNGTVVFNNGRSASSTNWNTSQNQVDYNHQQQQQQLLQQQKQNNPHVSENVSVADSVCSSDADTVAIATKMVEMHHGHGYESSGGAMYRIDDSTSVAPPANAYGMLKNENELLYITENCIVIGRNSTTSQVHFHVARNSFVSRKHFQVLYDPDVCEFYVACLSKNGIFVDDTFQRRTSDPLKLPKNCFFRFPSTEIRIFFESFVDPILPTPTFSSPGTNNPTNNINNTKFLSADQGVVGNGQQHYQQHKKSTAYPIDGSNVIFSPLKISIPKTEQKSPYPSPTGTVSAANSCPTSPRQSFPDYRAYNSQNNTNGLQSKKLFQAPSTSSYKDHEKPPYSYAQLIVQSISAAPDKQLTLSGIYSFISKHYPYYRKEANKGWQNSIRHNLSLNRYFIKVARSQDEPGKGSFWRIDPISEAKLIDQSYKKRRQRGSQSFRPPYGMPRSAPVSPSHDNSRENSPLHDIVMQSAPGSPGVSYQNHLDNHASEDSVYGSQNIHQSSPNMPQHTGPNYFNSSYQQNSDGAAGSIRSGTSQQLIGNVKGQIITNPSSNNSGGVIVGANGDIAAAGTLIAIKRHSTSSSTSNQSTNFYSNSSPSGYQQHHVSDMFDEMSGYGNGNGGTNNVTGLDSGDECENMKRPKYATEINQ